MFVKPAKQGLIIRRPEIKKGNNILPDTGADVPENSYWLRRLKSGEVVKAQPPNAAGANNTSNVIVVEGTEGGKQ
jgi:hypothetical protein